MYANHNDGGGGDAQRHTEEERQLQDEEEEDERATAEAVGRVAHTIQHLNLSRGANLPRPALFTEGVIDTEVSNTGQQTLRSLSQPRPSQGVEHMAPPPPQERPASVPLVGDSGQGKRNNTSNLEPSAVVQHRTPPSVTVTKIPNNIRNFRAPRKLTDSLYVNPEGSHRNESRTRDFIAHVHVCFAVNSHGEEGEFLTYSKVQYKRIDPNMDISKPLSYEERTKIIGHHDVTNKELRLFAR